MNQNTPTNTSFDLTFKNFDFNLGYMKFIGDLFAGAYTSKIEKLATAMRIWGLERSANPGTATTYTVFANKENGNLNHGREFISLPHDEATFDESNVLSLMLVTGANETVLAEAGAITPLDALRFYDTQLAQAKATLSGPYLAAYVSLRHLIATAARMATAVTVQKESIAFMMVENEIVFVFKVNLAHFTLAVDFPPTA